MKNKKNVFICGVADTRNNGQQGMVVSFVKNLRKKFPDNELVFTSTTICKDVDKKRLGKFDINAISLPWIHKSHMTATQARLNFFFKALIYFCIFLLYKYTRIKLINNSVVKTYFNADLIVDLSGDAFIDEYSGLVILEQLFTLWIGKFLKKPVIIMAQSIGPINRPWLQKLTKNVFSVIDCITLREDLSFNYLIENGFDTKNMLLTADLAFLLDPCGKDELDSIIRNENINFSAENITIGICPSSITKNFVVQDGKTDIVEFQSSLIKELLEISPSNLKVLLIPHVTVQKFNDRDLCNQIMQKLNNDPRVSVIQGEYSCEEIKGIIGQCDMLIGFRMHPTVASISLGIPTISIVWALKTIGVIGKDFGEIFTINLCGKTLEQLKVELIQRSKEILTNRDELKQQILSKVENIKLKSEDNIELAKKLLNEKN